MYVRDKIYKGMCFVESNIPFLVGEYTYKCRKLSNGVD